MAVSMAGKEEMAAVQPQMAALQDWEARPRQAVSRLQGLYLQQAELGEARPHQAVSRLQSLYLQQAQLGEPSWRIPSLKAF